MELWKSLGVTPSTRGRAFRYIFFDYPSPKLRDTKKDAAPIPNAKKRSIRIFYPTIGFSLDPHAPW